jgi:microcystin-dependent protein
MGDPFLGEIKMMSFRFAPSGWALCNGQMLPINQNQALYSLLGITFGGDGRMTFALPNLQGRTPIHATHRESSYPLGKMGGSENVALTVSEMPTHTHATSASSTTANSSNPSGQMLANGATNPIYSVPANLTAMNVNAVSKTGEGVGHENMQPYLTINFAIALVGIYPSRD